MSPRASVVVPTYHRPQLLDRCLRALTAQELNPADYEIIVVDDGPDDPGARAVVKKWQEKMSRTIRVYIEENSEMNGRAGDQPYLSAESSAPVDTQMVVKVETHDPSPRLIYLAAGDPHGPAAARNLGWRAASAEIIAFTDDDTIPEPDWLAAGLAKFEDRDVSGVCGKIIVPLPPHPTDNELNTTGLERSLFVTANCFYRKSALEAVGGFDEAFRIAWREDSDLFFSMRERGFLLVSTPDAVVYHPVRKEKWGSSLKAQRKSVYNALLYKKHPQMYRRYIQASAPWNYYMIVFSLLLGLVGFAMSSAVIAGFGLGIWIGMALSFAIRRLQRTSHAPSHVLEMIFTSLLIPFLSVYWRLRGAIRFRVWFL